MGKQSDLDKFFDKAGCDRPGAQRTAHKLWALVKASLTEREQYAVHDAWLHALEDGHDRRGLDSVRAKIKKRMEEKHAAPRR